MRTVYAHKATWDGPPLTELEGATIYNAPRPLYGHTLWEGDFRHGCFYVAIFPDRDRTDDFTRMTLSLDASLVEIVDNDRVRELLQEKLDLAGYSLADYEEIGMGIAEVAQERGLPWVEEETDG